MKQNDIIKFGGIGWLVLDIQGGMALILAERIICKRHYHDNYEPTTWEHSALRKWLNGEYYNQFSAEEKQMIAPVRRRNSENPRYGTSGGNSTTDKISLLSIDGVRKYLPNANDRIVLDENDKPSSWWLRSPGGCLDSAALVYADGSLDIVGDCMYWAEGGVRPALWLDLRKYEDGGGGNGK